MASSRSRARLIKQRVTASPLASSGSAAVHAYAIGAAVAAVALGVSAFVNYRLAARAERDNPPSGGFVEVDGVRLHYVQQGHGDPLVLLHGNGMTIADFESSGLLDLAASRYRVIAFDRPGYGYSERPRNTIWTDAAQADLIHGALAMIGITKATVLGHSWGCSVAVALALKHPELVSALVLESGYYYPTARADAAMASGPAIPVVGDVIRYSLSPILARLMWPLFTRKMFGPAPVPPKFEGFPKEMAFRPSQIRASAAEAALMIPDASARHRHYPELTMPVAIIAGEDDRVVNIDEQSGHLHADIPHSTFDRVKGVGHMVHQTAPERVMAAIDRAVGDPNGASNAVPLAA